MCSNALNPKKYSRKFPLFRYFAGPQSRADLKPEGAWWKTAGFAPLVETLPFFSFFSHNSSVSVSAFTHNK